MGEFIIYASKDDGDQIRSWINNEPDVAWIIKIAEQGNTCHWRAVNAIDTLRDQTYALWHTGSGPLNIPSGSKYIEDTLVADPLGGWFQDMRESGSTTPWFGGNLPGPYSFRFAELGREAPGSLGRSGFSWLEDRYKSIGKPAHPDAKRWWKKLKKYLDMSAVQVPWTTVTNVKRPIMAYVFPGAELQISQGRHRDINP